MLFPLIIGRVFSISRWSPLVLVVKRDYFTEEFIGIDLFRKKYNQVQKSLVESNKSTDVNRIRKRIETSGKIRPDDLSEYIYISRTSAELEFLFNAIKKYKSQTRSDRQKAFYFAEPYMRLLYILSETDHALKLVLTYKEEMFIQSAMSLLILMHRLFFDQRYDDMVRLFKLIVSIYPKPYQYKRVIETYLDGLIEKNNLESVSLASEVFDILKQEVPIREVRDDPFRKIFYIAITQKNNQLAQNVMPFIEKGKPFFVYNCKIILQCRLNKVDEAIDLVKQLLESPLDKPFAYETYAELEVARYRSNDENIKEKIKSLLDEMIKRRSSPQFFKKFIMTNNLVSRRQAKSLVKSDKS